jgi:nucleoid DNA-binding protein
MFSAMNKSDLIREVHERMGKNVSMKDLDQIVDAMLGIMSEKLKVGEEVQLADFGTFSFKSSSVKTIAEFLPKKKKK